MKRFFTVFVLAAVAIMAAFSCTKEEGTPLVVSISADAAFKDGAATVKVYLMEPAAAEVSVNISAVATPSEGYTAIDAADLEFNQSVKIPAGSKESQQVVRLRDSFKPAAEGKYEAVLSLYGASGAKVSEKSNTVHIAAGGSYGGDDFGPGGGDKPVVEGMTLVKEWSVSLSGDPYTYDGEDYQDYTPNLSGIKFFWAEALTAADIAEYGTLADLAKSWADDNQEWMAEGDDITDIAFSLSDKEFYMSYPGGGTFDVYIIEFAQDGSATGRYGVCTCTFAEYESEGGIDIEVPDTFTKNSAYSVEYIGRYQGTDYDDNDKEISVDLDVFSAAGTGEAYWVASVEKKGTISANIAAYAQALAESLEEYCSQYEWYEWLGMEFSVLDVLCYGGFEHEDGYGYIETEALDNGEYEAVVFLFTEEGNFSGEYGLNTVTVDGRGFEWPQYNNDNDYLVAKKHALRIHKPVAQKYLARKTRKK